MSNDFKQEKIVFYTLMTDDYYDKIGTIFINSFKKFHPDIEMVVYRQEMIDEVLKEREIVFEVAKPIFAKLLVDSYDLVVNMDADTIITGRLEEVLKNDYEVGSVVQLCDICKRGIIENVTKEMYVQSGMVASRNKRLWDIWEEANIKNMKDFYVKYQFRDQDILNLVWYNDPEVSKMKRKVFDKDKDCYGAKFLGREKEFYIEGDKLMCRGERVLCYHHARGPCINDKLQFDKMEFTPGVIKYLNNIAQGN